jgi:hypothetical protein
VSALYCASQSTLRYTSAVRRTARMQCQKNSSDDAIAPSHKNTSVHKRNRIVAPSSSTDEESGSVHSNAGLQVQLPAAAEKKTAKKIIPPRFVPSIIPATSDDDAPLISKACNPPPLLFEENMFFAKDSLVAKERLKQTFNEAHLGGHPRCINSRCVYTLAFALQFFLTQMQQKLCLHLLQAMWRRMCCEIENGDWVLAYYQTVTWCRRSLQGFQFRISNSGSVYSFSRPRTTVVFCFRS